MTPPLFFSLTPLLFGTSEYILIDKGYLLNQFIRENINIVWKECLKKDKMLNIWGFLNNDTWPTFMMGNKGEK